MIKPTETGRNRYPPDGYYDGEPCTCEPECGEVMAEGHECKSKRLVGCSACSFFWSDNIAKRLGNYETESDYRTRILAGKQ